MIISMQMLIYLRESVLTVLNVLVPPLITRFVRKFSRSKLVLQEDDLEEQVYAEYDDECGVVFFPPVHAQRYAAVCDCLMDERWFGRLQKVLNVGKSHDINFLKYLTELPGINQILGLDIECSLNCTCDMLDLFDDYGLRRMEPLQVTLLQGNVADPDYRLIGCDAVVAIEMIQQLLPHDLDRLVHNVFGFIKPWIAIFTTPNADFNHFMKNLDKNGLRQPDHYFEWTRAQLHDWCSNIVERYPDYTVISTGVGPGPDGTSHYGCYSQLVLLVSKWYKKEMELDVDSLVLVTDPPEPMEMTNLCVWTSVTDVTSSPSMHHRILEESMSLSNSYTTIDSTTYPSAGSSVTTFQRVDKSSQCNVDAELGKSFVMFQEEEYEVRMPRKRFYSNIYEIGDVASRLNNTTCEVKQFSKTTQYLLEKNEIDITDTQVIMNEISMLTGKLTGSANRSAGDGCAWNNVNWGENVPYWNQYYKVVGVYNYPCDEKSEDDTILDLLFEEINKFIDTHCIDGPKGCQFAIPVLHLMQAVGHMTDDVQRVVNLLEDNGYEIDGDLLVVPAVDNHEDDDDELLESYADVDNVSNESTYRQDFNGWLDRTLCRKMKKLQVMLPNDKEIRQVLCHVICRLKKIALSSRRIKEGVERSKWLQAKLLELLTITEKSILRKNLRNSEFEPFKNYSGYDMSNDTANHLTKIKAQDDTVMKIVEKYENILQMSADGADSEMNPETQYTCGSGNQALPPFLKGWVFHQSDRTVNRPSPEGDNDIKKSLPVKFRNKSHPHIYQIMDDVESVSNSSKPFTYNFTSDTRSLSKTTESGTPCYNDSHCLEAPLHESEILQSMLQIGEITDYTFVETHLDSIHDWEALTINREKKFDSKKCLNCMPKRYKIKKSRKKARSKNSQSLLKKYKSSWIKDIFHKAEDADRCSISFVTIKNIINNSYSCKVSRKNEGAAAETTLKNFMHCCNELAYIDRVNELNRATFISTAPKPIPSSIIELCHPELIQKTPSSVNPNTPQNAPKELPISATQKLQIIEILTQDETLTIALKRTIGTSPDEDSEVYEHEFELSDLKSLVTGASSCEIRADTSGPTFQESKIPPLPIALSQNTQIVEILTQDTREIVVLQHTVGTDPILHGILEPELEDTDTKIKSSLKGAMLHENNVAVGNEPFFLHDVNEPTTSKGRRHVTTEVQCGTDATMSEYALLSAATSLTNLLNIVETEIKTQDAVPIGADSLSYDIINPKSSLRIKSVGIKIKDSDHEIPYSLLNQRIENETTVEPATVHGGCVDTDHNNSMEIRTTYTDVNNKNSRPTLGRQNRTGRLANGTKKNISKPGLSVENIKRSIISANRPKLKAIGDKPGNTKASNDSANVTARRYLRLPHDAKTLRRGGVHVHSYKDLQVSEDVVYQGEWQRYREKPLRNNPKKPIDYTMYRSKYVSKINVPKQTEEAAIQRPKTVTINARNARMSKLKKKESKIDMQNKIDAKSEENKTKTTPITVPKVASKLAESRLKLSKKNSKTKIQLTRQTRLLSQTINSNANVKRKTPNSYIPHYLRRFEKQIPKTQSKSRISGKSSDSLSNLLKVNDEYQTSSCKSTTKELISALLRVSIEPSATVSYTVFRNKTVTSKLNTPVEKLPAIPARTTEKDIVGLKLSSRDRDGYAGSSRKCLITVLNSQSVTNPWPNLLNNNQQPPLKKSNMPRKSSDRKIFSKIRKLANKIMSTKKTTMGKLSETSSLSTSSSKTSSKRNVDLVLKPSVKETFIESPESKNESAANDDIEGSSNQEPKIEIVLDPLEITKSNQAFDVIQDLVKSASKSSIQITDGKVSSDSISDFHKTADHIRNIHAMQLIIEEGLHFLDTPVLSRDSEAANVKHLDLENDTSPESSMYVTCSSPAYDTRSPGQIQSISDFSFKSASFISKISECFADNESCNVSLRSDGNIQDICQRMEMLSITQKPTAGPAYGTRSIDPEPSPLVTRLDYVNSVDSETGSLAVDTSRLTASEEVFVSGRTSQSYVSCALDEESEVPDWLFHSRSHQASDSAISRPQDFELPVGEIPPPFELGYDENGNELPVRVAAGAGDGHGVHSDLSQDSSGRGTTSSSSVDSSTAHSEGVNGSPDGKRLPSPIDTRNTRGVTSALPAFQIIVIDPVTFAREDAVHDQPNTSNVEYSRPVSIDTSFTSAMDMPNSVRVPYHSTRREALPASDADVSSIDTDIASD